MKRPTSETAVWTVVAALLVVPVLALGAWAALASTPDPTAAGQPATPLLVPVTTTVRTPSVVVTLHTASSEGRHAASHASGTVTAVSQVGDVLADGTTVAKIDDRPVRAMVAKAPLWRVLSVGARGEDVQRLGDFLVATGYLAQADDVYGARYASAVAAFNRDAGVTSNVRAFDPATVVWVGRTPLTVASIDAPVGSSTTVGDTLVTGPSTIARIKVTEPDGGLGTTFGTKALVAVGDATVPYDVGSGTISDRRDAQAIATALGTQESGTAEVRTAKPQHVHVVPASSLATGSDGTTCVYADATSAPTPVTPVGGGASTVQLDASFALAQVLANPGQVDLAVPCGS